MERKCSYFWLIVLMLTFFLTSCASINQALEPRATVTTPNTPSMDQRQSAAYSGSQARIAVTRFTDRTAKGWYSGQIGDSMSMMLTSALLNTNKFIVLERETLSDVIGEQDLGASGRVKRETAAPIGEIEGAELLVKGAVTEFEPAASGASGGISSGRFGWGEVAANVLGSYKKAHIAIDIHVIDAKTSRIVANTTVVGSATNIGGGTNVFANHVGVGLGMYRNTAMEKAIRVCIQKGADFIAGQTPPVYYRH